MLKKALLGGFGVILLLLPHIAGNDYIVLLVILACIYSILGMGFSMTWKNRLITCGQAGFWAIGAYSSALLVMELGLNFWVAMPLSGLISALFAFIVYSIALRAGPLVFFSMSLVFSFIVMEVLGTTGYFGGWEGIMDVPSPKIGGYVLLSKTSQYYLALSLLLFNILVYYALYKSPIGRAWSAIGSNVRLAEAQGINVYRYRLGAAVISCFFAGVVGSFYAHTQNLIVPTTFSFHCSIYVQMYALIGGLSFYIAGPIIGALVMVFLPEFLRSTAEFQPIFFGVFLILIIIFIPGGILSIPQRFPRLAGAFLRMKK